MEGFLWLLLQMALLLLAAAVVFFLLGWRWRGQNATRDLQALHQRLDAESASVRRALEERDAAQAAEQTLRAKQSQLEADLLEAQDHRRNLERELIRGHEELKMARREAQQRGEDLSAVQSNLDEARREIAQLRLQSESLQRQLEQRPSPAPAETAAVHAAPAAEPAPVEKPKRVRKPAATAKPKAAKPVKAAIEAQATLARLETDLATKETLLQALRQELEDWQRRVAMLREKGKDPAGLGLAQKSLSRAESQVAEASTAIAHLQHQQSSLRRSLDQAAHLSKEDDLTQIKGIKAVLRDQLHAFGIRSFQQIAEWTEDDVEAFGELLSFKDRAKRDHWVQQAKELL